MSVGQSLRTAKTTLAAAAATAAVLAAAIAVAGWKGPAYLAALGLGASAGLAWGWLLFGRNNAAGWLAGLVFGYFVIALAWWTDDLTPVPTPEAWVVVWGTAFGLSWLTWFRLRGKPPLVALPRWTRQDLAAMLLTMSLVPALVGVPFARIGEVGPDGGHRYRAYFTADFVWHMALVEELAKPGHAPVNPYLAPERLHYYWTYFLVPAAMTTSLPDLTAADALALNALACGLAFVGMLYLGAWSAAPSRPWLASLAVTLVVLCGSAEGLGGLVYAWLTDLPLAVLRDVNVDGLAAWTFKGLRIDNLPRALWYTPQHAFAFTTGAIAILAAAFGAARRAGAIVLAGTALGLTFTLNPFVGAVSAAVYLAVILEQAWRASEPAIVWRQWLAGLPILAALAWCASTEIVQGASRNLVVGWWGPATRAPIVTLALSFLPAALPALAGWLLGRGTPPPVGALVGVCVSLALMFSVALRVDPHWVGFRTGHLIFGFLPPLVAWGLVRLLDQGRRALASAVIAVTLAAGLPTTAIDVFNAQDVENRAEGPGFPWTMSLTPDQWSALKWIREQTALESIVQAEPVGRGRGEWSLIPSFAGRRMAAGLPISLMHDERYDTSSQVVEAMFDTRSAHDAYGAARRLGIDYLYVDAGDYARHPNVSKFAEHPECFEPVYRNHAAAVFAVRREVACP